MEERTKSTEKLADKAFSHMMFTSFFAIFVCIVFLTSSTFALFYDNVPSVGNNLKAMGACLLSVTVEQGGEPLSGIESGVELEQGKTYRVTLSLPSDSASGYCVIVAETGEFYTPYIAHHDNAIAETVSFELIVGTTQTVRFESRWGIYSRDCDVVDEILNIP